MASSAQILHAYILRLFLPVFCAALAFFILIVELIDLFGSLWRYLSLELSAFSILKVQLLYLPTCINYAIPVALLFATAYTLGSLYARNELIAVFCSGLRLSRLVLPLLAVGLGLSLASFFFNDGVVLDSYRTKTELSRKLLGQNVTRSNADVAVISADGRLVYKCTYYDDAGKSLSGLAIVERDLSGKAISLTQADSAHWDGSGWTLSRVRRFQLSPDGDWLESSFGSYRDKTFSEPPSTFRNQNLDVREMSVAQLASHVAFLRRAGLPFAAALAERHKRFSFTFTPLIVVLLSAGFGGRFRKNVLLMSLLSSLLFATAYYVFQMVTMLLARTGLLPPFFGAWLPFVVFSILGLGLFRRART